MEFLAANRPNYSDPESTIEMLFFVPPLGSGSSPRDAEDATRRVVIHVTVRFIGLSRHAPGLAVTICQRNPSGCLGLQNSGRKTRLPATLLALPRPDGNLLCRSFPTARNSAKPSTAFGIGHTSVALSVGNSRMHFRYRHRNRLRVASPVVKASSSYPGYGTWPPIDRLTGPTGTWVVRGQLTHNTRRREVACR
jgi:hypothetical protein